MVFSHSTLTASKFDFDSNFAQGTHTQKEKNHIPANLTISLFVSVGNDFSIQSKLAGPLALKFRAI